MSSGAIAEHASEEAISQAGSQAEVHCGANIMENLGGILEEARDSNDERVSESSNNDTEDRLPSAHEQLAELQLLARADLHSPVSVFSLPAAQTSISASDADEASEGDTPQFAKSGLSSFSAILAASRKLATTSTSENSSIPANGVAVEPLDQGRVPLSVDIPGQRSRQNSTGKSLPTLNEGAEGEEEDEDEESPETPSAVVPAIATDVPRSPNTTMEMATQEEEEAGDDNDVEFLMMLEHLSRGEIDFLALTIEDLTVRKLGRVHTALSLTQTLAPDMPYVRTLVSVDMLRLLLQRLGVRAVGEAIRRALRQIMEREETATEVAMNALLTSSNIATVVLAARQDLFTATSAPPALPRGASPSSSRHQTRGASHASPRSLSSSASPLSSSQRCSTPKSPAADRRSILAKDGVHVLMQERLVSFDHRGQATALPAFRVRSDSATTTDQAAKRRQRGLQYAHEHVPQRTMTP